MPARKSLLLFGPTFTGEMDFLMECLRSYTSNCSPPRGQILKHQEWGRTMLRRMIKIMPVAFTNEWIPVPVRNTSNDIWMILKGSVKKKTGIPNRARIRENMARYLFRLSLKGFLLPLPLPISDARSQTAPAGHMYRHTHRFLKKIMARAITPRAFNHTRLFWLRNASRNI